MKNALPYVAIGLIVLSFVGKKDPELADLAQFSRQSMKLFAQELADNVQKAGKMEPKDADKFLKEEIFGILDETLQPVFDRLADVATDDQGNPQVEKFQTAVNEISTGFKRVK
jgi:hypothetical protein